MAPDGDSRALLNVARLVGEMLLRATGRKRHVATGSASEKALSPGWLELRLQIGPERRTALPSWRPDFRNHTIVADSIFSPALALISEIGEHRHGPVRGVGEVRLGRDPVLEVLPQRDEAGALPAWQSFEDAAHCSALGRLSLPGTSSTKTIVSPVSISPMLWTRSIRMTRSRSSTAPREDIGPRPASRSASYARQNFHSDLGLEGMDDCEKPPPLPQAQRRHGSPLRRTGGRSGAVSSENAIARRIRRPDWPLRPLGPRHKAAADCCVSVFIRPLR